MLTTNALHKWEPSNGNFPLSSHFLSQTDQSGKWEVSPIGDFPLPTLWAVPFSNPANHHALLTR